jgi:hypothetical protein
VRDERVRAPHQRVGLLRHAVGERRHLQTLAQEGGVGQLVLRRERLHPIECALQLLEPSLQVRFALRWHGEAQLLPGELRPELADGEQIRLEVLVLPRAGDPDVPGA